MKIRGIALKLSLLVLTSVTLIFVLVLGYNYVCSSRIIIKNLEKNAHYLTEATVNKIDKVLYSVEKIPRHLTCVIENAPYTSGKDMIHLMFPVLEKNPEIYGIAIAFEPYAHDPSQQRFAPYVFRTSDKTEFTYIPYEYFYWDWYQIPKWLGHAVWSEPYFDEGAGNIVMSTYSVPFYKTIDGERKFAGVITADISLSWLQEIVESIKIKQTGYGFLISKNGTFVTHPDHRLIMNETIFSVSESLNDPYLRQTGREMIKGKAGFIPVSGGLTGTPCWMAYSPMPSNGWSLGVLFPKSELMADITDLNHNMILIFLAGFALTLGVIVLISRSITKPLRMLSSAAGQIATGNLDVKIPRPRSKDEVGRLADSFDYMKSSLKQYINDLRETTAAKQKIESELKIAHDIQMGILPKIFPPFPDRPELDIYAILEPAKDVGGDLYDFFFIDDDHICFTIGDVSGKGVPAALFMAITRTLIKTRAVEGVSPDSIMSGVNRDFAMDNPSMMFVTLFFGILNTRTGQLTYSNGGHNPPYLVTAQGHCSVMENTEGMILGVMEDAVFESKTISLEKGDLVFLYTDGITEAINQKKEMFSENRLEGELRHCVDMTARQLIEKVQKSVKEFTKGMEQFDDITMLSIGLGSNFVRH